MQRRTTHLNPAPWSEHGSVSICSPVTRSWWTPGYSTNMQRTALQEQQIVCCQTQNIHHWTHSSPANHGTELQQPLYSTTSLIWLTDQRHPRCLKTLSDTEQWLLRMLGTDTLVIRHSNGFTVATQNALKCHISIGKVIHTLYTSILKCGLKSIQCSATN